MAVLPVMAMGPMGYPGPRVMWTCRSIAAGFAPCDTRSMRTFASK